MRVAVMSGAAMAVALGGVAWAQTAPPPASAFGRMPGVYDAAISPNGKTVAILGGSPEVRSLSLATIDQPGLPTLNLGDVKAVSLRWVGDDHVLARIGFWKQWTPKIGYRYERNISVNLQGQAVVRMLDKDVTSQLLISQPVVGLASGPPAKAVMIGVQDNLGAAGSMDTRMKRKGESGFQLALFAVDPANGKATLLEKGGYDTYSWEVDQSGEARVRHESDEISHKYTLYARAKGVKPWTALYANQDEEWPRHYAGYASATDSIYMVEDDGGASQVVRHALAGGATEKVGAPVRGSDVALVWDRNRDQPVGVMSGAETFRVEWLDPEIGGVHAMLAKAFKGKTVTVSEWSADRTRFLVRVNGQGAPGAWHLFDRARKELSPIGEEYPELKDAALGTTRWITYKARDGLEIPAYLTLPPGAVDGRKLPLIVMPHGGPVARDDDDFDWLTQFLATRGYAVLRPQFRGSAGFGRAFEDAGRGEWAGKMQTDLLDGIAAVAASNTIDPARVCIFGWSFGGYAALAGVSMHPEAYKCAASMAGVSDLGLLITEQLRVSGDDSWGLRSLRRMLDDASSEKILQTSPVQHVADIRAPVLLMHGDQDGSVDYEQSQRMASALKAAGKPVEFVTFKNEDHFLLRSAPRTQLLETLGAFLAKNLPVNP
ncbi:alpha/beta hydrolase family protein [Phenylobacterium sp.]|uniref:alpha/beta hydrolase family protein n=1 Tax=Phenylobacterium sp. TaxID=1871053 RepID=UPI0035B453C0